MDAVKTGESKGMVWAGRVVSALPVLLLLFSATMKFVGGAEMDKGAADLGWPVGDMRILGVVEVSCTVIYLIPQTAVLGAVLLTGYLGGAVATHARLGQAQLIMPALAGMLVWLGLFLRDRRVREILPLRG